jgi:8-oxo-dGTP pyrophosphatase MutT (NUDIX family)
MDSPGVRVAVYVTRERGGSREVLVLDVPRAGTQVPVGGVDPDERLVTAARREVAEDTGMSVTLLGAPIAVQQRPHAATGANRVTVFFHATTDERRDAWTHRRNGCFFVPLAEAPGLLTDHQGEFVDLLAA